MGVIKPVMNLVRYGSLKILPQVDPDVMRPIFEEGIKKLSFYSPRDHLDLWKTRKEDLRFHYSSEQQKFVWFNGIIYAQEPRNSFGEVDVVSFMNLDMINPDKQMEVCDAIKSIAKSGGIEKIVACPGFGNDIESARRLADYQGNRLFAQLRYGLGAFANK